MMKNSKKGFNLIEIAIVLAVVGLVIGGIYVAASSVTDNQRKQKAQTQLLTIVQNMRTSYSNQTIPTTAAAVTGDILQNSRIMPADMPRIGTTNTFNGAYGPVSITLGAADSNTMAITMNSVSRGACIDIMSKNFGSTSAVNQIGLRSAGGVTAANTVDGITVAEANTACAAEANDMVFDFSVRG